MRGVDVDGEWSIQSASRIGSLREGGLRDSLTILFQDIWGRPRQ